MNICPPDCFLRGVRHGHAIPTADAYRAFFNGGASMPDQLPPIDFTEKHRLASLVHAARNLADLGVKGIRVWRIDACYDEHGDVTEEQETDSDKPPTAGVTVKCALCAVRRFGNPYCKATRIVLIRG